MVGQVSGVRRGREKDDDCADKRAQHTLDIVPATLEPEALGFSLDNGGFVEVVVTTDVAASMVVGGLVGIVTSLKWHTRVMVPLHLVLPCLLLP